MNTDSLINPRVKAAIEAMRTGDRNAWFSQFTIDAILTDDGTATDFTRWSDNEVFEKNKGYLMSIDRVNDSGLTIYGKFHSDRWGEFDTFMKFKVQGGKIIRLDVGQITA